MNNELKISKKQVETFKTREEVGATFSKTVRYIKKKGFPNQRCISVITNKKPKKKMCRLIILKHK